MFEKNDLILKRIKQESLPMYHIQNLKLVQLFYQKMVKFFLAVILKMPRTG
jgi:hypothetical protein